MTKKSKSFVKDNESSWFDDPRKTELFLWLPVKHSDRVLLAGNQLGYKKIISQLLKLKSGQNFCVIGCNRPTIVPPAQWCPSPLNKRKTVHIDEVEKDFQRRVSPPVKFRWLRELAFFLNNEISEPECILAGDAVKMHVPKHSLDSCSEIIKNAKFPRSHGYKLAHGIRGHPSLWLAADWLGAE